MDKAMNKSELRITTHDSKPSKLRGTTVRVYDKHTEITYMFYGHMPRLLNMNTCNPDYYHPSMFAVSEAKKFIRDLPKTINNGVIYPRD